MTTATRKYVIVEDKTGATGFVPRGGALALWQCKASEVIIAGPAETGKTRACIEKLDGLLHKYNGAQAVMVRKVRDTIHATCLQTYLKKVLRHDSPVTAYGGEKPQWFDYPNGSRLWLAGIDDPGKALSSERDFVYCFVGETPVETPSPVVKAYRRAYSGPLVTIRTAGGNQLTGTPNHPALTDSGWVALGCLKIGDYVISRSRQKEVAAGHPNVNDRPPAIAEVYRSLAKLALGPERVAGVDMDFHGDGGDGDIDVVTAHGFFENRGQATVVKPIGHRSVRQASHKGPGFERLGAGDEETVALRFPAADGESFGKSGAPVRVAGAAVQGGLPARQWGQTAAPQLGFEYTVAHPDSRRECLQSAFPFQVSLDRVVDVRFGDAVATASETVGSGPNLLHRPMSCHVYNLETVSHYYIAGGVIVHNCNQAEELTHDDWQVLTTRATGRAGNAPYGQVFGDCNPGPAHHWIKNRPSLTVLESRHEDNPTLWDADRGEWTEQGRRTLAVLDGLTGVRLQRLRYGRWVSAEGAVYSFDPVVHRATRADLVARGLLTPDGKRGPACRMVVAGVDWGYTAPGVLGVWPVDGDGRMALAREHYRTKQLIGWWVERALEARRDLGVDVFVCDPSEPAYIEQFLRAGLNAQPADNDRKPGHQAVETRMAPAADGRPRLALLADALVGRDEALAEAKQPTCTEQEFDSFVWKKYPDGRVNKEETTGPDHGMDQTRYASMYVDMMTRGGTAGVYMPRTGRNLVEMYGRGLP